MSPLQVIIALLIFIASCSVYGQEPAYKNYTASDGLASTNVYQVMQDSKGFIWFATDNGVSRFDGSKFKNYSVSDGLSDNSVLGIKEDSKGRIWFLTANGQLSFYLNDKIYSRTNCDFLKKINANAFIISFYEDSKKNIWIGWGNTLGCEISPSNQVKLFHSRYKSLLIWQDESSRIMGLSTKGKFLLTDTLATYGPPVIPCKFGILLSKDSLLLLRADGQLCSIGKSNKMIIPQRLTNYVDYNISALSFDRNKNIWLCTLNGAIEYEGGIISREHEHDYLKNYSITYVFRDKDNNLWFSSNGNGVFMIPSLNIELLDEKSGLTDNNIISIAIINDNELMVGALNGGIQVIENGIVKNRNSPPTILLGSIVDIKKYKDGSAYVLSKEVFMTTMTINVNCCPTPPVGTNHYL